MTDLVMPPDDAAGQIAWARSVLRDFPPGSGIVSARAIPGDGSGDPSGTRSRARLRRDDARRRGAGRAMDQPTPDRMTAADTIRPEVKEAVADACGGAWTLDRALHTNRRPDARQTWARRLRGLRRVARPGVGSGLTPRSRVAGIRRSIASMSTWSDRSRPSLRCLGSASRDIIAASLAIRRARSARISSSAASIWMPSTRRSAAPASSSHGQRSRR